MIEWLLLYFPYIGIFLLIVLGGIGFPFPEDLTLILAGQLAYSENLNIPLLVLVCFIAIIPTDYLLYYIGRRYGSHVWRLKLIRKYLTPKRRVFVREQFQKKGDIVVFIARFVGGMRTPTFITAGTLKMSPLRFLFLDITASLISIPLFILLSYYLGQAFAEKFQIMTHKITLIVMALVAIFFVFAALKTYWEQKKRV